MAARVCLTAAVERTAVALGAAGNEAVGRHGLKALEAFEKANPPEAIGPLVAWLASDEAVARSW